MAAAAAAPAVATAPDAEAGASFENDSETCAPHTRGSAPASPPAGGCMQVGHAHPRAVLVGDLLDHRQPEAGALALGRHVGLERALQHLVGEAGAVVDHVQAHQAHVAARRCAAPRCAPSPQPSARSATASSAFCTRLWITWRSCVVSPTISGRSAGQLGVQRARPPARCRRAPSTSCDQRVQVDRRRTASPAGARSRGTR